MKPHFWREGGVWACAVPKPDPFAEFNIRERGEDWWKRYGLIGRGKTREEALRRLNEWQEASDFVASIY